MTARVPDGEQPVGGEAHLPHAPYWSTGTSGGACWCDNPPPHPRPAEPTVDGLAELEALRAMRARVEALYGEASEMGMGVLRLRAIRRALDGD